MQPPEGTQPLIEPTTLSDNQRPWFDWNSLIRRTIARFASGSIAVQNERILLPEEQEREHAHTAPIARQWKERAKQRRAV